MLIGVTLAGGSLHHTRNTSSGAFIGRAASGSVSYGYRIGDDGRPEIYEPEAEVMRRNFQRYVEERLGGPEITRLLTNKNAATPQPGAQWHNSFVMAILSKEVYEGEWRYGKKRWISAEDGQVVRPATGRLLGSESHSPTGISRKPGTWPS